MIRSLLTVYCAVRDIPPHDARDFMIVVAILSVLAAFMGAAS